MKNLGIVLKISVISYILVAAITIFFPALLPIYPNRDFLLGGWTGKWFVSLVLGLMPIFASLIFMLVNKLIKIKNEVKQKTVNKMFGAIVVMLLTAIWFPFVALIISGADQGAVINFRMDTFLIIWVSIFLLYEIKLVYQLLKTK